MSVSPFSCRCLQLVLLLCYCCRHAAASDQAKKDGAGDDTEEPAPPSPSDGPAAAPVTDASEGTTLSELGLYLGAPCELSCNPRLTHVFCDKVTGLCECEKRFPVRLDADTGCAKPVALGSQCLYAQACSFTDQHAECTQVNHNAVCQCKSGYHEVSLQRPSKRVFCSPDQVILSGADAPTLFGVATGLAILGGMICFVLKLFSRARYSRPRHYANANLAPPILFSSETGIPLAVHAAATGGRPSSRASSQRSMGSTFGSGLSRRPSSSGLASLAGGGGCRGGGGAGGAAVSSSRAGSRRPSLASIHSNASSQRSMSFSARRFERENQQREARQQQLAAQAQAALAAAAAAAQAAQAAQDGIVVLGLRAAADHPPPAPSPSPRTPLSTDELLPSVSEVKEEETATPILSHRVTSYQGSTYQGYQGEIGPCTSSDSTH